MNTALQTLIRSNAALQSFWARRGYIVNFTITQIGPDEFLVTSDMVNGLPRRLAEERAKQHRVKEAA